MNLMLQTIIRICFLIGICVALSSVPKPTVGLDRIGISNDAGQPWSSPIQEEATASPPLQPQAIDDKPSPDTESSNTDRESFLKKRNSKRQSNAYTATPTQKLEWKLLKQMRQVAKDYQMLENGDHIMVCVSGGKDSATLLVLLQKLQHQLQPLGLNFDLTVVHVDQKQPGYDGRPLLAWLENLGINYHIVEEDTYSVVVNKTQVNKSYCTVCSRLRRGILYSKAMELGCNKLVLGHHADDALETLWLNMMHAGQMKAMPARYTSRRGQLAVMRPLITCLEADIAEYAKLSEFPILPCNLCGSQDNLQRPQVKLMLSTMESFSPNAKINMMNALMDVRPSHLLDQSLRRSVGMDPITGEEEDALEERKAP